MFIIQNKKQDSEANNCKVLDRSLKKKKAFKLFLNLASIVDYYLKVNFVNEVPKMQPLNYQGNILMMQDGQNIL